MKIKYGSMLGALTILIGGTLAFGSQQQKNLPIRTMMLQFEAADQKTKRALFDAVKSLRDFILTNGDIEDEIGRISEVIRATASEKAKDFLRYLMRSTYEKDYGYKDYKNQVDTAVNDYSQLNTLVKAMEKWFSEDEQRFKPAIEPLD